MNPKSKAKGDEEAKYNCPHCGELMAPLKRDTQAGTLLICPECMKLVGRE
ncbi:Uncharacterised protein [Candidatus Gugararchaeum adminiculabundum]|nr:Uncharacterised protein [Candidatus Gugararchaeum adminiculabundum]